MMMQENMTMHPLRWVGGAAVVGYDLFVRGRPVGA